MDEINVIRDDEKTILINKNLPAWVSVSNDCYDIIDCYYKKGIKETVNKFKLSENDLQNLLDEINDVLTKENTTENDYPLSATIFLTDACNFNCLHCFYGCGKKANFISESTLINCLEDLKQRKVKYLTLTGGEPLLYKNFEWCIKECRKREFEIFLLTNGSLLDEENVKTIVENNVYVQVSLDGVKDTFEKVRNGSKFEWVDHGIELLKKYNVPFDISFTPNNINIDSFDDVINYAIDKRANGIHIPILEEYGNAKENIAKLKLDEKELLQKLIKLIDRYYDGLRNEIAVTFIDSMEFDLIHSYKKTSCSLGTNPGAIYVDGKLYACSELIEAQFALQDYNESSIIKTIEPIAVDLIDECKECTYKYYCGGGCRFHSFIESGDFYHRDSNCDILKACFEKILLKIG